MNLKPIAVAALVALGGSSAVVHAATVTYSGSYSGPTDVTNQLINVQQFDGSLGVLTGATFGLSATMDTRLRVTGDAQYWVGWDKTVYQLSLTGDTGYSSAAISANGAPVRIVGSGTPDGSFTFSYPSGGEYATVTGPTYSTNGPTLTQSNNFALGAQTEFVGNGLLDFYLTTVNQDAVAVGGAGSPSSQGVTTSILANVSVTYTYDPGAPAVVPVPAAAILFPAGIGLIGFSTRRRKV